METDAGQRDKSSGTETPGSEVAATHAEPPSPELQASKRKNRASHAGLPEKIRLKIIQDSKENKDDIKV